MFAARRARGRPRWLASCRDGRCDRYFTLEDPRRLEPAERELYVETLLDSRLLLRGFVDRVDVAPDGAIRVVDYKTGRSPGEVFEAKALFQMKFYALVLWRTRGVVPAMLQLVYLGNGEMLRYVPDERDLLRHRAQGRGALAGDPRGPRSPATGGPARRGCATGAPTRRSAPPSAALRRRCRSGTPRRPRGRLRSHPQAAWVRSSTPIRANAEVRCAFTVRSLMPSRRAICLLARPSRDQAEHLGLARRELTCGAAGAEAEQLPRRPRVERATRPRRPPGSPRGRPRGRRP